MEILTSAEMGAVDRRTAEQFGVPLAELMERAGRAVAEFCLRQYPTAESVLVLCGKGNNGGDGFVAARLLAKAKVMVRVVLLGQAHDVKGEAASALKRMQEEASSAILDEVVDEAALRELWDSLDNTELFVDAVVGTGFKPPLRGLPAVLREMVANTAAPVVAVDLPSGWDADSLDQTAPDAFRADAVVTFTRPKLAHVFGHLTSDTFGPVVVAEIGSPTEAVISESGLTWAGAEKAITEKPREVNSNKGMYGHVLVVGGSYGTAGAPEMASLAALRAGAGLVTAAVPKSISELVAAVAPELMLAPMKEGTGNGEQGTVDRCDAEGTVSLGALPALWELIEAKRISVVALGPGLSTRGEAPEFVRRLVADCSLPMVIDADALNAFEGRANLLDGSGRTLVLTPHPGEMARLTGLTIAADRGRPHRSGAQLCHGTQADPGAEGMAHAHCASRWANRGEYQRQPGDGQGRQRRHPHRNHRRHAGPVPQRCCARGGGCRRAARACRGLCRPRHGRAHGPCHRHAGPSVGRLPLSREGRRWPDLDLRTE